MTRVLTLVAVLCAAIVGCSTAEPAVGTDAGRDAAAILDTGGAEDGGALPDTGTAEDSAVAADTGTPEDTGVETDAAVATGACMNAADLAGLSMDHMGQDIGEHTADCAPMCIGSAAGDVRITCVNDCLQEPTRIAGAISTECTTCFAAAADCVIANCLSDCIASATSPACIMCQCDNCSEAQVACSGIPDDRCP